MILFFRSVNDLSSRMLALAIMSFLLTLGSCKKDSGEPADEEQNAALGSCTPVAATGTMTVNPDGTFSYVTAGGGKIKYDVNLGITISHKDYEGFYLDFWGYFLVNGKKTAGITHESLSGKHIKDRLSFNRTFVFPDGAKITWLADSIYGKVTSFTIFEGAQTHHFNAGCNTLERSVSDLAATQELDNLQPDGETSTIEISSTGLIFVTLYAENKAGEKVTQRVLLGELFRDKPNQVNDYYDDPRLGAT